MEGKRPPVDICAVMTKISYWDRELATAMVMIHVGKADRQMLSAFLELSTVRDMQMAVVIDYVNRRLTDNNAEVLKQATANRRLTAAQTEVVNKATALHDAISASIRGGKAA